jgi:hypothetical protein
MIDIIHDSFMSELRKIANEGQTTALETQSSDVSSKGEISPAVKNIFGMKELTRIRQEKDEKGNPGNSAHGSPVISTQEAAQKLHDVGKQEGYRVAAREGVQHAAAVGKKSFERGYQSAARQGVELAAQSYMKGRNANT